MSNSSSSEKPQVPSLAQRTVASKKQIGRSVDINGVHAIDVSVKKSQNINDPILDVGVRINNPIGRLLLALKRIWKSQNTVIGLKFTIPLLVLPILLYAGWRLWQGRGMNVPASKLGVIHQVPMNNARRDIFVLPSSDVYLLEYSGEAERQRIAEKPVIVIGNYSTLKNTLYVEEIIPYNEIDLPPATQTQSSVNPSVWDTIWRFIQQFR